MNANETVLNDFINKHPFAVTQTLEVLPTEKVASFLQKLSLDKNKKLLELMSSKKAANCFILLSKNKSKELIENVEVSIIAALLKHIDVSSRSKLLNNISSDRVSVIKRQLAFLPNSIATLMETAIMVNKEMTVENALQLFKYSTTNEDFFLYVIDLNGNFKGIVKLKDLFSSEDTNTIEDVMQTSVPSVLSDISIKTIIEHSDWLEYQELPVLDTTGKLMGKLLRKSILKYKIPVKNSSYEIEETGNALGELFRIGLNGLLQGGGK